ncbi:hypothetical protein ACFFRE_00790 [Aciditerrimonas ferrireducens]|jgi:hypothetical protein|uniref:Uncharacterized protein n=1 Tax=Aciditerrimonas ferrireducens TaxID=667306 RepID=A0ABV6BZ42_9ACTN
MPDAEASEGSRGQVGAGLDALVEQIVAAPTELSERLAAVTLEVFEAFAPAVAERLAARLAQARAELTSGVPGQGPRGASSTAAGHAGGPVPGAEAVEPVPEPATPTGGQRPSEASRPPDPALAGEQVLLGAAAAVVATGQPVVLGYAEVLEGSASRGLASTEPLSGEVAVRLLQRLVLSRLGPGDRSVLLGSRGCGLVLVGTSLADAEARFADLPASLAGLPGELSLGLAAPLPDESLLATFHRARRLALTGSHRR